jgi:hypothetical protein
MPGVWEQGDVPTVRGAAIIGDGGRVKWSIQVIKKRSAAMRIGVQVLIYQSLECACSSESHFAESAFMSSSIQTCALAQIGTIKYPTTNVGA